MWSVWSEAAELYLGHTLVMLQIRGREVLVMEHANLLAADQLLGGVSQAMTQFGTRDSKLALRLRVVLSGALCPALTYVTPKQVTQWSERMEIARATAAIEMGTTPDQVVCEMDTGRRALASAMRIQTLSALQGWAAQHQFAIASIQPLWAIASQSRTASKSANQGLVVMEPDATTVLADDGSSKLVARTQAGLFSVAEGQANTRRILVGLGLRESALLKLSFGTKARTAMQDGPRVWPNHWYSP